MITGGAGTPFLAVTGVLHNSLLVDTESVCWLGMWVGRKYSFGNPVSLKFVVCRCGGVDVLLFDDVLCLSVFALFNFCAECDVVSVDGVDKFFLLNDVCSVDVVVD